VSLTTGHGPLGSRPAGRFNRPVPAGIVYVEPFPRRVRGILDGTTVVDSDAVLLVHRADQPPTFAFPAGAVDGAPSEPEPEVPGYVAVRPDAVDRWFEEDEPAPGRPRNPYHRVDCVRTSRRVRVAVAGTVLADTTRTVGVYETSLAPRLYVPRDEVRTDLLTPSATTTWCAYKGTASYWDAVVDGVIVPDVAWSYEDPYAESAPIRGLLCFDASRAEVVEDLPPGRLPIAADRQSR
jgi:uncharacterized protein (DUF427 family)